MAGKKNAQSWRDLKSRRDSEKKRPVSLRARLKSLSALFKKLLLLGAVLAILGGTYWAYERGIFENALKPETDRIKAFEMKTTGHISAKWLFEYIALPKGTRLSEVDIFPLKETLERLGQIEEAHISRVYPHTLRIEITERVPVVKTAVRIDSRVDYLLMTARGKFFSGVCMPQDLMDSLPAITGIRIVIGPDGPVDYPHAQKLAGLLEKTRERLGDHFKTWKLLDLSELSSLTVPLITVTTQDGVKIVFAAKEYEKQLDRLEYILKYSQAKPLTGVERIDLSLSDRADVKLRE